MYVCCVVFWDLREGGRMEWQQTQLGNCVPYTCTYTMYMYIYMHIIMTLHFIYTYMHVQYIHLLLNVWVGIEGGVGKRLCRGTGMTPLHLLH